MRASRTVNELVVNQGNEANPLGTMTTIEDTVARKKAGRKSKHRIETAYLAGPVEDLGPREIWNHAVVLPDIRAHHAGRAHHAVTVRGALEAIRAHTFHAVEIRPRSIDAGGRVIGEGSFRRVQTPLDALYEMNHLGDRETETEASTRRRDAGNALTLLYSDGELEAPSTASWNSAGGGGVREKSDYADLCESRYRHALNAIRPYDLIVSLLCCHAKSPTGGARSVRYIREGLDKLALHFDAKGWPKDLISK